MGKEWLMLAWLVAASPPVQSAPGPAVTATSPAPPTAPAVPAAGSAPLPSPAPSRCDARQYRALVGRTLSDVLTQKLPQGTRIVRIGDPKLEPLGPGRLVIEINRNTRVGRIYCS